MWWNSTKQLYFILTEIMERDGPAGNPYQMLEINKNILTIHDKIRLLISFIILFSWKRIKTYTYIIIYWKEIAWIRQSVCQMLRISNLWMFHLPRFGLFFSYRLLCTEVKNCLWITCESICSVFFVSRLTLSDKNVSVS